MAPIPYEKCREFVLSEVNKIASNLLSDKKAVKEAVRKYTGPLLLDPVNDLKSKHYWVEGNVRPFSAVTV